MPAPRTPFSTSPPHPHIYPLSPLPALPPSRPSSHENVPPSHSLAKACTAAVSTEPSPRCCCRPVQGCCSPRPAPSAPPLALPPPPSSLLRRSAWLLDLCLLEGGEAWHKRVVWVRACAFVVCGTSQTGAQVEREGGKKKKKGGRPTTQKRWIPRAAVVVVLVMVQGCSDVTHTRGPLWCGVGGT